MEGAARLYHNHGDGTFVDVAPDLGIVGPPHGFTCMFWDYDNDGRLDIFVADYSSNLAEVVADYLGLPVYSEDHAHLYHNLGTGGFREVSREAGLARPMPTMSVNAGDIDNDGDLDLYLGTGWMSLSGLVPDLMYINVGGRFEDVTESSGTGHLQKGHGVSFADWDDDGDLDLFVVLGGGYPGDRGYNALFQNPGHGRHWLKVRLVGTKTNRSAIGAKIRVDLHGPGRLALDPPRDRQQRQLRRQLPCRIDRPARCEIRRPSDRHLAHQQDNPDLPRPRRRPGDRDHRGDRRISRRHEEAPGGPEALNLSPGPSSVLTSDPTPPRARVARINQREGGTSMFPLLSSLCAQLRAPSGRSLCNGLRLLAQPLRSCRRSSRSGSSEIARVRKPRASNPRPSCSARRAISTASRMGCFRS